MTSDIDGDAPAFGTLRAVEVRIGVEFPGAPSLRTGEPAFDDWVMQITDFLKHVARADSVDRPSVLLNFRDNQWEVAFC